MKKTMLIVTISFVVVTVAVFFLYPYMRYRSPLTIEGIYIRYSEHEFGKEWDTLAIRESSESVERYTVTRRWRYERVLDGRQIAPEYKRTQTSVQFLQKEGLFLEEESGLRYVYNERKEELMAGTTIYKRIK
jgi:hypothetical protein